MLEHMNNRTAMRIIFSAFTDHTIKAFLCFSALENL